ncbi:RNA-processing protein [Sulfolobus acidocaldarius SUSAZ]|nr:RNA-processing protein [Sulfolobus acidocaldarius SUSAZ]
MYVTVPDERLDLIKTLSKRIEEISNTTINFDEVTKQIRVIPKDNNSYNAMKVISVINALGFGFEPNDAMRLMSDDYGLEIINLKEFTNSVNSLRRIKGRVIGEKGKTKRTIEEYTGVIVLVKDHEIGLLGNIEQLSIAKRAIELLIEGKEHNTVYKYLDKAESYAMLSNANRNLKEGL